MEIFDRNGDSISLEGLLLITLFIESFHDERIQANLEFSSVNQKFSLSGILLYNSYERKLFTFFLAQLRFKRQ